ncbi:MULTISPECIES: TrbG/VirB9 family P-type conjugative transfer protein [unclassified Lysobacter]|uniref:TrbG/VirB9 family P-type conjugative transfer protein n=1 Tax=unclassified Lysobacter TaxID=2635362 RepID=UPI001BEB08FF|nr:MULTISPECIES: TrbG/VirB9 family P-type conjugative transfer protein [unclassified Lysobacter]MBT2746761.1 TrbG/VirB9 family P-type conjugative transfer protein [Lysobacter sp. ISL-42]MBT2751810.1 TrbG/VirB9 family P-type conjugative transfer protein [Lysobacter sp. ISL-50]MBT2778162.1 TrbG/VirB9 family P-type conjugative transfer protein [Lysobacter sp. ISL-54]MBT2781803.1 TrbG/VirB9 family P-type conjugative transfer protein [Lysobacter sp. ISL-52]
MNCLRKHSLIALFLLALSGLALPASAQVVQEYEYESNRIYQVRTGLGITTQIELSPSENILDYSTGFSSGWDLSRRDNIFYLKPKNVDVDTNMMIRTTTHSYILELKVVATDWRVLEQAKQAGVQYKIKFVYPNGTEFSAAKEASEEDQPMTELNTRLDKNRLYNFEYQYSSRKKQSWLVPSNVYDDGQFTYIKISGLKNLPTGNFPAVFGRERESGEDFVVNTTVEGNTIVVHGTYPYLIIRHGNNVVGLRRKKQK